MFEYEEKVSACCKRDSEIVRKYSNSRTSTNFHLSTMGTFLIIIIIIIIIIILVIIIIIIIFIEGAQLAEAVFSGALMH